MKEIVNNPQYVRLKYCSYYVN